MVDEPYLFTRLGVEQDPTKLNHLSRVLCNVDAVFVTRGSHMDDYIAVNVVRDGLRRRLLLRLLLGSSHGEAVWCFQWVRDELAECIRGGKDRLEMETERKEGRRRRDREKMVEGGSAGREIDVGLFVTAHTYSKKKSEGQ
jgi:hypothetical protein